MVSQLGPGKEERLDGEMEVEVETGGGGRGRARFL